MKCDELKPLVFSISDLAYVDEPTPQPNFQNPHDHAVYKATEVEEAIAELKAKLDEKESWVKMLGEGEAALSLELEKTKQKLESVQASMYADVVDANMENRRLKRALWLCRYGIARMQYLVYRNMNAAKDMLYWYDKQKIFRAKAEEFK